MKMADPLLKSRKQLVGWIIADRWILTALIVTDTFSSQAEMPRTLTCQHDNYSLTWIAGAVNLVEFCCSWSYGILLWELFTVGKWSLNVNVSIQKLLLAAVTLRNIKSYC